MRAFTLFFASALCGLIVPVLHGQSVEPARPVSMRVLSFEGIVTDLAVRTPDGLTRILARANAFSPEITALSSGGGIDFYRDAPSSENSAKGGPGNAQRAPVARIAVQPGVNRYLVIVMGRGSSDDRVYSAYSIPDADGALPVGSARVVNFTDAPLAVQLGNNSAIVRTAESSVLACPSDSGGRVNLQLARPDSEQNWELVTRTRLSVPKGRRLLLLVSPSRPPKQAGGGVVMAEAGAFSLKILYDAMPSPSASLSALSSR